MVTNLKEETTESWINIWKIKQGNEKIVETSQEKQTENQALQETKVWLFMVEKKKRIGICRNGKKDPCFRIIIKNKIKKNRARWGN